VAFLGAPSTSSASDTPSELSLQRAERTATQPLLEVKVTRDSDGERVVSVTSTNASFQSVVKYVARELGLEVVGLENLQREPAVLARLIGRTPKEALAWIAGSVGFTARVVSTKIEVADELPPYPTQRDLFDRADVALWSALADHPQSPQAPRAAWIRAEIASIRSDRAEQSARLYDSLVEDYPDSDLVPAALLEAGKQYGVAGLWAEAIERFDDLAGYRSPHPYGVEARRRLAESHTQLAVAATNPAVQRENAYKALLVLDALDDSSAPQGAAERRERLIIRARASSLNDDPLLALRSIDLAATYSVLGDRDPELMDLRATALDRAGQYQDAFLAWLQAAEVAEGAVRGERYARAAASANACGAHLAAMATWKTAANEGLGRQVAAEYQRAEVALGLETDASGLTGDRDRIHLGEAQLESRRFKQSMDLLRPIYGRRFGLESGDRLRVVLAYARALDGDKRLDEAIQVLRTGAQEAERLADRNQIYMAASVLFERNDDIERAIAAMNGSL